MPDRCHASEDLNEDDHFAVVVLGVLDRAGEPFERTRQHTHTIAINPTGHTPSIGDLEGRTVVPERNPTGYGVTAATTHRFTDLPSMLIPIDPLPSRARVGSTVCAPDGTSMLSLQVEDLE